MDLHRLGWNPHFERQFAPLRDAGMVPARVTREDRDTYRRLTGDGAVTGWVSGRFRHEAASLGDFPAVGDWVAAMPHDAEPRATIHAVLPRTSAFRRNVPGGRTEDQVVAANVDAVFLMTGLDGNFRVRRIERYLTLAFGCGAMPVIVLTKADLCAEVEARMAQVELVAPNAPVHAISATEGTGLEELAPYLQPGRTVALMGSSGVGKSTLINALLGEEALAVQAVRGPDGRGRHTTTHRELVMLPHGGLVIDTPGMRELSLWGEDAAPDASFADVAKLARQCRFADCAHRGEPGCAVQRAIAEGALEFERYDSYLRLQREALSAERRQRQKERMAEQAVLKGRRERENRRERRKRRLQAKDRRRHTWEAGPS